MSELWQRRPEVQQLLHRLVDRLDRAVGEGVPLQRAWKLDRSGWPAFHAMDLEEDREALWECVRKLEAAGCFTVKLNRAQVGMAPYELNPRLTGLNESRLRELAGRPTRVVSRAEAWRDAVNTHLDASAGVKELVGRLPLEVGTHPPRDIVQRLALLPSLVQQGLLLREASATLFWGHSKVLDRRQLLICALLGVDECPFPESRIQLLAYLPPAGFDAVLFIENQATFERATYDDSGGRYGRLAVVYAAGFRSSAQRLRRAEGASVFWAEHGTVAGEATTRFKEWLARDSLPTWFFGDLDYAGMSILRALRASFPDAQAWRPGYEKLLAALHAGGGHSAVTADKAGQPDPGQTGCSYADEVLLPAMRKSERFVDQEKV